MAELLQSKTLTGKISTTKVIDAQIVAPREGVPGATFTPHVSEEGIISWTNDRNLPDPESVDIRGPEGPQGVPGERGADGVPGPKGDPGKDGTPGKDGLPGPAGADGFSPIVSTEPVEGGTQITITDSQGEHEFTILNGEKGEAGPKGDDGAPGKDGTVSFDELTPEQKAELKGDQGPEGPQGEPGERGADGLPGKDGAPGEQGPQGPEGPRGPNGVYVGAEEPQDTDILIWIDTNDSESDITSLVSWGSFEE